MGFDCMWIASTGFHLIFWIASRLTTNLLPVLTRSSLVCTKQWFDCTHIRWHVSLERKRKINVQHSHKAIAKSKASIETYLVVYRVCSRSRLALCFSFFLCAFFFLVSISCCSYSWRVRMRRLSMKRYGDRSVGRTLRHHLASIGFFDCRGLKGAARGLAPFFFFIVSRGRRNRWLATNRSPFPRQRNQLAPGFTRFSWIPTGWVRFSRVSTGFVGTLLGFTGFSCFTGLLLGCYQVCIWFSWVSTRYSRVFTGFQCVLDGFSLVVPSFIGFHWLFMSFSGFRTGFTGFDRVLLFHWR